jgi:CubicO group peptidase (beta-lactamase class C family)
VPHVDEKLRAHVHDRCDRRMRLAVHRCGRRRKMFTAAAVLEMGSAGALALDEPVQRTSAVLTRRLAQLTLHQLLSHAEASHVTFAELVRRRVRPIAHDTRLWPAGYAFTTASDLSRFAIALLDSGKVVTGIVRTARFVVAGPNDRSRLRFVLPSRVPALRTLGVPRVS